MSPIQDEYIEKYIKDKPLDLRATLDRTEAYKNADFVVIVVPTNDDPPTNDFYTRHIEYIIDMVTSVNTREVMVIKSTISVVYCRLFYLKYSRRGCYGDQHPLLPRVYAQV